MDLQQVKQFALIQAVSRYTAEPEKPEDTVAVARQFYDFLCADQPTAELQDGEALLNPTQGSQA